jgi:hypothetical protein
MSILQHIDSDFLITTRICWVLDKTRHKPNTLYTCSDAVYGHSSAPIEGLTNEPGSFNRQMTDDMLLGHGEALPEVRLLALLSNDLPKPKRVRRISFDGLHMPLNALSAVSNFHNKAKQREAIRVAFTRASIFNWKRLGRSSLNSSTFCRSPRPKIDLRGHEIMTIRCIPKPVSSISSVKP